MTRAVLATVVKLVLSVLLAALIGGLWQFAVGSSGVEAFLEQGPRLMLVFMWPGLIAWAVLCLIGMLRRRGLGWGILGSILAALLAAIVNLVASTIIAFWLGGADIFYVALAVIAGGLFLIAASVASVIAHLAFRVETPVPADVP